MNPDLLLKTLAALNGYLAAGEAAFELGKNIVQMLKSGGVTSAEANVEIENFRQALESALQRNQEWLDTHPADSDQG